MLFISAMMEVQYTYIGRWFARVKAEKNIAIDAQRESHVFQAQLFSAKSHGIFPNAIFFSFYFRVFAKSRGFRGAVRRERPISSNDHAELTNIIIITITTTTTTINLDLPTHFKG